MFVMSLKNNSSNLTCIVSVCPYIILLFMDIDFEIRYKNDLNISIALFYVEIKLFIECFLPFVSMPVPSLLKGGKGGIEQFFLLNIQNFTIVHYNLRKSVQLLV